MRKTIIASNGYALEAELTEGLNRLDLGKLARVEISSEDALYPIEQALTETAAQLQAGALSGTQGWRAELLGPQTMHLRFDAPQTVKRVLLHFRETVQERSQEFSLHATTSEAGSREIVRQQWSFSPDGSTSEQENYLVDLKNVTTLTLWIDPDRGRNRYHATLVSLRVEG